VTANNSPSKTPENLEMLSPAAYEQLRLSPLGSENNRSNNNNQHQQHVSRKPGQVQSAGFRSWDSARLAGCDQWHEGWGEASRRFCGARRRPAADGAHCQRMDIFFGY
jgi:hypothetical protein